MEVCREEIVLWVLKKTGSAITTILSKESAESFLSRNVTAVIGYFDNLDVSLSHCLGICHLSRQCGHEKW